MKTKNEYIESLATELKEWSAQIDVLTAKSNNAADNLKQKYAQELELLNTHRDTAAEKLKELQEDSGNAWDSVKESADKVWNDLRSGIASAASKFD